MLVQKQWLDVCRTAWVLARGNPKARAGAQEISQRPVIQLNDKLNANKVLVSYVGEMQWWPIQSLNKERRSKANRRGNEIKFTDLRFERGQVVGFGKGRRTQDVP